MELEISLNDLIFYAYHGVFEEERKLGNEFKVDLTVKIPFREEIEQDELSHTLSYAELYAIVEDEMKVPRNLLEKLALEIVKRIKKEYPSVISGLIRITKVRPPIVGMIGSASVTLYF